MAIFEYGKYKIDIDEEKTKKLFDEEIIEDTQNNRNFQKYVAEMMSDEEKAFFKSLHIDPSKINVSSALLSKTKAWVCASYGQFIVGKFLSYPKIEIDEDPKIAYISVGNFNIHLYTPKEYFNEFYHQSDDIVENSIYLTIEAENLPWLLKERCRKKEHSDFFSRLRFKLWFIFYIPNRIRRIRDRKMEQKKLIEKLEYLKLNIGLSYEILSDKETKEYKKIWVDNILPKKVSPSIKDQAYNVCLYEGDFLWHIFSFNIVRTIENPTEEFNKLRKKSCTLVFKSNKDFTVNLKNAENLDEQDIIDLCNQVAGSCDFVITADDFSWAYSRTHEDGWLGPYFYKKN